MKLISECKLGTFHAWGHQAIIDGKVVPYDACSEVEDNNPPSSKYDAENFEYFGTGNIYSVSGVFQGTGFGPYHFYKRLLREAPMNQDERFNETRGREPMAPITPLELTGVVLTVVFFIAVIYLIFAFFGEGV